MNEIIFESKLRGLIKEFRTKITLEEMDVVISKVIGDMCNESRG